MSTTSLNAELNRDEVATAIAEVESLATAEGQGPGTGERTARELVPIPVPVPGPQPSLDTKDSDAERAGGKLGAASPTADPPADQAPEGGAGDGQAPASDAAPPGEVRAPAAGLTARLLYALRPRRQTQRQEALTGEDADATPPSGPSDSAGFAYRSVEFVLDSINRPFAWLSPNARRIVGAASVVTIIMSLLAGGLLPRLVRRNDAVEFLHQKRAALLAPKAAAKPAGQALPAQEALTPGH